MVEMNNDGDERTPGRILGIPFRTLLSREVNRFLKVWTQTLFAPLLTSALYIVVFGYGLGSRIRQIEGVPYLDFILPGLILLSIITASYGNTSSSLFDAKRERYIDDVLISPMTPLQMALAYVLGASCAGWSWAWAPSPWRHRWQGFRQSAPCCS
jgi:ABC-2 type transport system permease protein